MRFPLLLLIAALLAVPRTVGAEPLRLHGQGAAARAISGPQKDELGWGGALRAGLELPFGTVIGLMFEANAFYLADGAPPQTATLRDQTAGTAFGLGLGVQTRPLRKPGAQHWGGGLWNQVALGTVRTSQNTRLTTDINIGFDFPIFGSWFALGPALGWLHVFQPDSELRPADGNLFTIGVHGLIDAYGRARSERQEAKASP